MRLGHDKVAASDFWRWRGNGRAWEWTGEGRRRVRWWGLDLGRGMDRREARMNAFCIFGVPRWIRPDSAQAEAAVLGGQVD
jgi:hypothetical protein